MVVFKLLYQRQSMGSSEWLLQCFVISVVNAWCIYSSTIEYWDGNLFQESESGSWHVPVADDSCQEPARTWLCITRPSVFKAFTGVSLSQKALPDSCTSQCHTDHRSWQSWRERRSEGCTVAPPRCLRSWYWSSFAGKYQQAEASVGVKRRARLFR